MFDEKKCLNTNEGVHCEVTSCAHHQGDCGCDVSVIKVDGCAADCPDGTCCDSFRKR